MAEFGRELRLVREARGVSLDTLSAETKVQTRHFEALEQGDFHELPGGVFRRGILRAYLKALQLEEQPWMVRFDESVAENARTLGLPLEPKEDAWATFATNVKRNRMQTRRATGVRWLGVILFALILAASTWAVWERVVAPRLSQ
jgi:cytoskeletal protein RodZ